MLGFVSKESNKPVFSEPKEEPEKEIRTQIKRM